MTLSTGGGYGDVGLGPGHLPVGGTVELRCRSTVDMDQVEMGQGLQGQALGLGGAQSSPRTRRCGGVCGHSIGGKMDKMRSLHISGRTCLWMALWD